MTETSGSDTGPPKETRRYTLATLVVGAVLLLVVGAVLGSWTRTFLVEARSFSARIVMQGESNAWELRNAVLCTPRDDPNHYAPPGELCPLALFEVSKAQHRTVGWPAGAEILVRLQADHSLSIEALSGTGSGLPEGSRFVVPWETWDSHGALLVNGSVVFGSDVGSGSTGYLIAGRWQAHQSSWADALFQPSFEVVKEGEFARGATVQIWRSDLLFGLLRKPSPATVFGHITPSFDSAAPGLILSFLSEARSVELRVRYPGLEQTAIIGPGILDTILTSPVMLAAIVLLTLAASVADLISGLGRGRSGGSSRLPTWMKRIRRSR